MRTNQEDHEEAAACLPAGAEAAAPLQKPAAALAKSPAAAARKGRPAAAEAAPGKEARAALETPEEAQARRRRKREEGVRAVKRTWHYRTLEDLDAARPPTPPTSPRDFSKRGFEKAVQEWRKELIERVQQHVKRGDLAEVYLEQERLGMTDNDMLLTNAERCHVDKM